ncbi:MAG: SRPBCC domain-containing protein [Candidatus Dormibacteria bacterium]
MTATDDTAVTLRRVIDAPRARVFDAWTAPDEVRRWWGPGEFTCPEANIDLREGGAYRLVMRTPGGGDLIVTGNYREVRRPERLVYTWRWTAGEPAGGSESVVTVEFHELGERTEIVLSHTRFAAGEDTSPYRMGWEGGFDKLDRVLTGRALHA